MPRLTATMVSLALAVVLVGAAPMGSAAQHPMDPLTADEIIGAAGILLAGGAATRSCRGPTSRSRLRPHNFFDRNPALDLRRAPFEVAP
jgi:Cu2+-containing amine oxidase